jgi:hypothetical protein
MTIIALPHINISFYLLNYHQNDNSSFINVTNHKPINRKLQTVCAPKALRQQNIRVRPDKRIVTRANQLRLCANDVCCHIAYVRQFTSAVNMTIRLGIRAFQIAFFRAKKKYSLFRITKLPMCAFAFLPLKQQKYLNDCDKNLHKYCATEQ